MADDQQELKIDFKFGPPPLDRREEEPKKDSDKKQEKRKKPGDYQPNPPVTGPTTAPPTIPQAWVTGEFLDPNATSISKSTILATFPSKLAWQQHRRAARETLEFQKQGFLVRMCYVAALRNSTRRTLEARDQVLMNARNNMTTFGRLVTPAMLENHGAWVMWFLTRPAVLEQSFKHLNWLDLQIKELAAAEGVWENFWYYSLLDDIGKNRQNAEDETSYGKALALACEALAKHNKRRLFLQRKIHEGMNTFSMLYDDPPALLNWGFI